jgi:hypothetical protein
MRAHARVSHREDGFYQDFAGVKVRLNSESLSYGPCRE